MTYPWASRERLNAADLNAAFDSVTSATATAQAVADAAALAAAAAGTSTFVQAGTGAVTRTVTAKLREVVSVTDYGAVGDGTADDTAAIQAALNTGRCVFFPPGTYRTTGPLTVTTEGQQLTGSAAWGVTLKPEGTGYDVLTFGTAPPVTVIRGCGMQRFRLDGAAHSNGATIRVINSSRMLFQDVHTVSCWNAWDIARINVCTIISSSNEGARGDFIIRWYGDAAWRSDVLRLFGFSGSCTATGGSTVGLIWDGNCHTLQAQAVSFVNVGTGLLVRNTSGATKPAFLMADDFEVDFPTNDGVLVETGSQFYFHNLYSHGSANGSAVYVAAAVTDESVVISTAKLSGAIRYGIEAVSAVLATNVVFDGNTLGEVLGTAATTSPRFKVDTDMYLGLTSGGSPILNLAANDYLQYDRTNDVLSVVVNSASVLKLGAAKLGFYGATSATKPTITGSRGANAAVASLLTSLATLGLITDSTTV